MPKFTINGSVFNINAEVRNEDYSGNPCQPTIYARPPIAGKMVKQFVKQHFPKATCKVKSDSFSDGNSLNVWVSNKDGSSIPEKDFERIDNFVDRFRYGKFNGMIDMYEYNDKSERNIISDEGIIIEGGVKYTHCQNRPAFDTVEGVLREVLENERPFEEVTRYVSDAVARRAKQYLLTH